MPLTPCGQALLRSIAGWHCTTELHTAWSVPIVSDNGTLLGTFGLHHTKAQSVGVNELELLEKAGHIALIAIDRDRAQTALTEALAEVKKSEAELRTIVDMIPQLIAVLAPDGQALYYIDADD